MPPPADAIIPAPEGDGEARRRALAAFAHLARSPKPLFVFATHARGGGVARHVRELAALLAPRADVLVLRPHRRSFVALEGTGEHREARLWFHRDDDWPALTEILRALGVARLHFHHVQGLPPQVLDLGRAIGCPWDVTVHDYYPACPQYQLEENPEKWPTSFIGAHAMNQARLFNEHATGAVLKGARLDTLMAEGGVNDCGNAQNCVQVCPKHIPLTESIATIGRSATIHAIARWFRG